MSRVMGVFLVLLCIMAAPLGAQDSSAIPLDQEPHHHLALKNDLVEVFNVDLAQHDAFKVHRHDHDDVAVVLGEAVTVSTATGKPDMLQNYKGGEVIFARSGRVHSVRNIGGTDYRMVSIDLVRQQTNPRNLCGTQVPNLKRDCPATTEADAIPGRSDVPQFETDQIIVMLTQIHAHQTATFGDRVMDELLIAVDDASVASAKAKGPDEPLAPGAPLWIAHAGAKKTVKNNGEKDLRVVTVAFKP